MDLAPIGVSVYTRLTHIKKTIQALKNNHLAKESHVYFFSDGPQKGDEKKVDAVRQYLEGITGFKKITILKRESNSRVFNNRNGMKTLLDAYGKLIFLEEDIITAPGFLQFMNDALKTYRDRKDIFAICGYTPPVQLEKLHNKDIYLSPRFSAWGFGIWKDRFEKIIFDRNEFLTFLSKKENIDLLSKNGTDLPKMLKKEANGDIDALDVKIFYTQLKYGLSTIAPTKSLTNNIGHDGTGIHCRALDKFNVDLPKYFKKIQLDSNIQVNYKINKRLFYFRSHIPIRFYSRAWKSINTKMRISSFKSLLQKVINYFRFYLKSFNKNRLIFCINSGRSGSNYLAELLGTAVEVESFHEAEPTMSGKYLDMINNISYQKSFKARRIKSKAIKKEIIKIPPDSIYCETSHMFIKTFFDVVLKDFSSVEVIILRRELALVLKSFMELEYFTSKNAVWPDWMSLPIATTAAIPCAGIYEEMDQYDKCIAYLVDIEARAQRFKQEYPMIKTHEVRLEALNDEKVVSKLFQGLNITATKQTGEIIGSVINDRKERKKDFNTSIELEYCRKRIEQYFEKAKSIGIPIPKSIAMDSYRSN